MILLRHVLPLCEWTCKSVQQTFRRLVDLGDPQDIVNVADDGEAGWRDKVCGRVAQSGTSDVGVQSLNRVCLIAQKEAVGQDWSKDVKVAFRCGVVR